jgi:hypothetical protein
MTASGRLLPLTSLKNITDERPLLDRQQPLTGGKFQ